MFAAVVMAVVILVTAVVAVISVTVVVVVTGATAVGVIGAVGIMAVAIGVIVAVIVTAAYTSVRHTCTTAVMDIAAAAGSIAKPCARAAGIGGAVTTAAATDSPVFRWYLQTFV